MILVCGGGGVMDEFLEFLNKWLVRPVTIITTIATIVGFCYVAGVLLLNSRISIETGTVVPQWPAIPLPTPGEIRLEIPGFDTAWRPESRPWLILACALLTVLIGLISRWTAGPNASWVGWLPFSLGILAFGVASASLSDMTIWSFQNEVVDGEFVNQWGPIRPEELARLAYGSVLIAAFAIAAINFKTYGLGMESGCLFVVILFSGVAGALIGYATFLLTPLDGPAPTHRVWKCTSEVRSQLSDRAISAGLHEAGIETEIGNLRQIGCYQASEDASRVVIGLAIKTRGLDRCELKKIGIERNSSGFQMGASEELARVDGASCRSLFAWGDGGLKKVATPEIVGRFFTQPGHDQQSVFSPS